MKGWYICFTNAWYYVAYIVHTLFGNKLDWLIEDNNNAYLLGSNE